MPLFLLYNAPSRSNVMRDDYDDDETTQVESWSKTPEWCFREEPTKAETKEELCTYKVRQTILKKRKQFCDGLLELIGPGTKLKYPEPIFTRKQVQLIIDAQYGDACMNPKEFGYIIWAAKYLGVARNHKVLEGLVRLGPDTDICFTRSVMKDDYYFQQVCRWIPESYIPRARYVRGITARELEILNERALRR